MYYLPIFVTQEFSNSLYRAISPTLVSEQQIELHSYSEYQNFFKDLVPSLNGTKARAGIELIGIEPNPGPPKDKKKVSAQPKQQQSNKPKKAKQGNQKSVRNNGDSIGAATRQYLTSVLFPEVCSAKLPDTSAVASSAITLHYDGDIATNAAGVGGIRVNLYHGGRVKYSHESSTSADSAIVYSTAADLPGYTAFSSSFGIGRIISLSVQTEYVGSDYTNQGSTFAAIAAANGDVIETIAPNLTAMQAARDSFRARVSEGVYCRYKPMDSNSDSYRYTSSDTTAVGVIHIHISGAQSSVTSHCRVRITVNLEAIPTTDALDVTNPTSSPVDLQGYSFVRELMAGIPSVETFMNVQKIVTHSVGAYKAVAPIVNQLIGNRGGARRKYHTDL